MKAKQLLKILEACDADAEVSVYLTGDDIRHVVLSASVWSSEIKPTEVALTVMLAREEREVTDAESLLARLSGVPNRERYADTEQQ